MGVCTECGGYGIHAMGCPNSDMTVIEDCTRCGREIYAGEDFYEIGNEVLCEDCIWEWVDEHKKG